MYKISPLATPVQFVKGVGPRLAEKLARVGILTVGDLLYHIPLRYVDRRSIFSIADLTSGKDRTVIGMIVRSGVSFMGRRRKRIYEVIIEDDSKRVASVKWFHFKQRFWEKRYDVGRRVLVSGEVTLFGRTPQFLHPEIELLSEEEGTSDLVGRILPVYPLTEGVYQKTMRKIIRNAWDKYNNFIEFELPQQLIEEFSLADPWRCLQELHFPEPHADLQHLLSGTSVAHRTLIFDEFFFLEVGMALRRHNVSGQPGIAFPFDESAHGAFLTALPFELTAAQQRVFREIQKDMARSAPMNRLLQGDVGSGKTVVALSACVQAVQARHQVAIMAPTEILAEQHYQTVSTYLTRMGMPHCLLTGSTKGTERKSVLSGIASGEIPLVVGTHALIQEGVVFNRLGLIVVDEQHRFGVLQRQAIRKKGLDCDILVMTATPIPRTLAMTVYGDLDVSVIDELPAGRKSVITKIYSESQRDKLYRGMKQELQRGRQIYVIYPLIEESEKIDLKDATHMSEEIQGVFAPTYKVALLHGRMKGEEKEAMMGAFKRGEVHLLVATSVVEVGVDVPNASVMVIEHAERFGLSQLHQLRGRVGRSEHQSYCILMADYKRSEEARRRLQVMTETNDGFRIAEEDLAIRGPGEFIGTRQSGIPPFRVANLARDVGLLSQAREAAFSLVDLDPKLELPQHRKLRDVLVARWSGKLDLAQVG